MSNRLIHEAVNLNSDQTAAGMSQFHQSAAGLPAGASAFAAQQQRVAEAQLAALQHRRDGTAIDRTLRKLQLLR
jgi:hypothetical protein